MEEIKIFKEKEIQNFIEWVTKLNKIEVFKDFLEDESENDIIIIFGINGETGVFDRIRTRVINENIINELQSILKSEFDEEMKYSVDIYFCNESTGFTLLYGTYYPDGFEDRYEVIND